MTTENSGMMVTAVMQETNTSFLLDEVQLKRLSKELSRTNKKAIEKLELLMEKSTDDKVQMQCALKLIELDIDVKKAISQDQMQRLIAEIKLNRGVKSKQLSVSEDEDDRPLVDFTTIRSVN